MVQLKKVVKKIGRNKAMEEIDLAPYIIYDTSLKCFVLDYAGEYKPLCADGFQEAVIEANLLEEYHG